MHLCWAAGSIVLPEPERLRTYIMGALWNQDHDCETLCFAFFAFPAQLVDSLRHAATPS